MSEHNIQFIYNKVKGKSSYDAETGKKWEHSWRLMKPTNTPQTIHSVFTPNIPTSSCYEWLGGYSEQQQHVAYD